jgi:hypothetical protein
MAVVCRACHLTLRPGEPHTEDFCRGVTLAHQVAESAEFNGESYCLPKDLFEQFRDAMTFLDNTTAADREEYIIDKPTGGSWTQL